MTAAAFVATAAQTAPRTRQPLPWQTPSRDGLTYEERGDKRREDRYRKPHWVYRCYDNTGRLLYVGCSVDLPKRLDTHRRYAWWADQVAKVRATVHPTGQAAMRVEKKAIRTERPRWNTTHRWLSRDLWSEDEFRDYVYAKLRLGDATLASPTVVRAYAEYRKRFNQPLSDPRIDDYAWPKSRSRFVGDPRKFPQACHLIRREESAA